MSQISEITEATINGVYQTVGYLAIKGVPMTEAQLEAARQVVKDIEEKSNDPA